MFGTQKSLESSALEIRCAQCLRRVTVEYRREGSALAVRHTFACPLCQALNNLALPGVLTDVWTGHGPRPADRAAYAPPEPAGAGLPTGLTAGPDVRETPSTWVNGL